MTNEVQVLQDNAQVLDPGASFPISVSLYTSGQPEQVRGGTFPSVPNHMRTVS